MLPAVLPLSPDARAARRARAFVRETAAPAGDADLLDDAVLVASELVTNAVLHAGTPSHLEVRAQTGRVELRVTDGDARRPEPRARVLGVAAQGRGLLLLDQLCRAWGVDDAPPGKTVWCVLTRP